ncbi:uncharacterized protein LOC121892153 isoform X1 [Thunnus maccoyii]|uniref:uncharacterized protein LOC121892153 isoform X1 n=1 Tax=Thunnus maccoyii TaxID=8240 RepID=UPI001C4C8D21|nr:uncharacterized protein LOC121892153 isoform X1 [Thunnus maccoyii]
MSGRYFEISRENCNFGNYIPSGRQLPRTPPLTDVKRHLDFGGEDPNNDCAELQQNVEAGSGDQDDPNRTFDLNTHDAKPVCLENIFKPDDPKSLLKGMKGYSLTAGDLEFIEKMKEEKLIKKLQGDLEDVQRLLKKETMALELTLACREKALAELNKFPSCEELTEWVKVVLKMTSPLSELSDLDAKSLLTMVTKENVQKAVEEKRIGLTHMEKMLANKKKEEAEERGQLEKQIANEQLKVQGLMSQLSDLKSELAQQKIINLILQEAYEALQMQINIQEVKESKGDTLEELQVSKTRVKRGKERKKAVTPTERLQDATNQSQPTGMNSSSQQTVIETDNQTSLKDDAHMNTNESMKTSTKEQTKPKSGVEKPTKSVKAARGPQKKAEEQESNSKESVKAVRGRRQPAGPSKTAAPQPKNQSKVKAGERQSTSQQAASSHRSRNKVAVAADNAGEEAQNVGLRRSKRIASRR